MNQNVIQTMNQINQNISQTMNQNKLTDISQKLSDISKKN